MPRDGSSGVEATFHTCTRPVASSNRQTSVKVPPESTPTRQVMPRKAPVLVVQWSGTMMHHILARTHWLPSPTTAAHNLSGRGPGVLRTGLMPTGGKVIAHL